MPILVGDEAVGRLKRVRSEDGQAAAGMVHRWLSYGLMKQATDFGRGGAAMLLPGSAAVLARKAEA